MKYKLHIPEAVRYYLITKKRNRLDIVKEDIYAFISQTLNQT
jgi:hypothetical protein